MLLIHRTGNFLSHLATTELASPRLHGAGDEPALRQQRSGGRASRTTRSTSSRGSSSCASSRASPGCVLFGHSGGGPATSFYQAVAETGAAYCQGPTSWSSATTTLAGLPKADGLILVDAHPGVSVNGLRSLNAAVLDERDPRKIDPALDPFSPANGYDPKAPHYSDAFKQKYFKAQADRMNRLIDGARRRHARDEGRHRRLS